MSQINEESTNVDETQLNSPTDKSENEDESSHIDETRSESEVEENIVKLKMLRRGAKLALTRSRNELIDTIEDSGTVEMINTVLGKVRQKFGIFKERHLKVHEILDPQAIDKSNT